VTLSYEVESFVDVIDDATGTLTGVVSTGGGDTGSGGASVSNLPFATQGLIQLSTGIVVAGRILKGRIFVPGVQSSDSNGGVPATAYVSALTAGYNALQTALPNTLRVWSRTHGTSALVTAGAGWGTFAVLRSRRD